MFSISRNKESQRQDAVSTDITYNRKIRKEESNAITSNDGVEVQLSKEGVELAQVVEDRADEKLKKAEEKKEAEALQESFQEQLESAKAASKGMKNLGKLLEVARRIANGDKVPSSDEKKLLEYNPKLYQAAKSAAILNAHKQHKTYDSLFDDEEDAENKIRELEGEGTECDAEAVATGTVSIDTE